MSLSLIIRYGLTTAALGSLTAVAVTVLGTSAAWLVVMYRFPGRSLFSWALALPLAAPAFALAYGYADLLDVAGPSNLYFNWGDTAGCTSPTKGCALGDGYEYGYVLGWWARRTGDAALGLVAVARAALITTPTFGTPGHYEPSGARWLMTWPTVVGQQADLEALPPSRLMKDTRLAFLRTGWGVPGGGAWG
jgi:hypothetical protein